MLNTRVAKMITMIEWTSDRKEDVSGMSVCTVMGESLVPLTRKHVRWFVKSSVVSGTICKADRQLAWLSKRAYHKSCPVRVPVL